MPRLTSRQSRCISSDFVVWSVRTRKDGILAYLDENHDSVLHHQQSRGLASEVFCQNKVKHLSFY